MIEFCNYTAYVFGDTLILGYMEGSGEEGWNQRIRLAYDIPVKKPVNWVTKISILR